MCGKHQRISALGAIMQARNSQVGWNQQNFMLISMEIQCLRPAWLAARVFTKSGLFTGPNNNNLPTII
jgi:hypothetical protein